MAKVYVNQLHKQFPDGTVAVEELNLEIGDGELFVMRYDGSNVQQLTDNQWEDGTPAWQPSRPLVTRR